MSTTTVELGAFEQALGAFESAVRLECAARAQVEQTDAGYPAVESARKALVAHAEQQVRVTRTTLLVAVKAAPGPIA